MNRLKELQLLKNSIESRYVCDGSMSSILFKQDLARYHELIDGKISTCVVTISIDELSNLTRYYKNSPSDDRFGLFRPFAQRTGNWGETYEIEFLLGYFLGTNVLYIKCGIPTDQPYFNSSFVYDSQHRMLSVCLVLTGRKKVNKEVLSKCISDFLKTNDVGEGELDTILELRQWIEETDSSELDFQYVIDNESNFPNISWSKLTKARLEITFATEQILRKTILFKMNDHHNKWSTYRHIASGVWCDTTDLRFHKAFSQGNTDNTEFFKTNFKKEIGNLWDKKNTSFRKDMRILDGVDEDQLETFYLSSIFACVNHDEEKSKINLGEVHIFPTNLRNQLMLDKNPREHFPYHSRIKKSMDSAYPNSAEYANDIQSAVDCFRVCARWINDDIGKSNGMIKKYNQSLRETLDNTMDALVGKRIGDTTITEKNKKSFPQHCKRFSLAHLDTSHVFFAFMRKLAYEYPGVSNLCFNLYMKHFGEIVIKFVGNPKMVSQLEKLDYSYEKRLPTVISFCKSAYEKTVEELTKSIQVDEKEGVLT
jgi:hypothetical protein